MDGKKLKQGENRAEENGSVSELALAFRKLRDIQDELHKINEEEDVKLREVVPNLKRNKDKFDQLNGEDIVKLTEVSHKYNELRRPIYDRKEIITNTIPNFWFSAFISHPALCQLLTDEDHKVLNYLSSMKVEYIKDVRFGYTITFNFNPNPFFEYKMLTKTITALNQNDVKVYSASVKWKDGMGINPEGTSHDDKKSDEQCESGFFKWFSKIEKEGLDTYLSLKAAVILVDLWQEPLRFMQSNDK